MLERHNSCSSIHQGLVEEMMNPTLTPGLRLFLSVTCTSLVVLGHRRMTCSVSRRSWLSYALWKCHKLWITGKKLTKTSSVGCLLLSFDITTRIILSSSFLSLVALENNLIGPYPITSWEIDGETVERVSDFILGGSKVTADGDCSHEIKRHFLLGRKVMTNLDSIFKSRDIILPTKVHLVKAMVFPVVMYGCESWTVKRAEHWRIDAFELWCWRRLLRVPWTARRSNQSILKEISPGCSLEEPMLKLKLQYLGHLMQRVDSLEKTLMLGGIAGRRRRGRQRMRWLDGITNSMDMSLSWTPGVGDGQGGLACCDSRGRKESDTTEWLNWLIHTSVWMLTIL